MQPIDFIQKQPPFDSLTGTDLAQVAQSLASTRFPAGHSILTRGGPSSDYLYLIRAGSVRLERDGQVVQLLEEGEVFGYASLLGQAAPAFDVIAEEETELYQIPADLFHRLVERPAFAEFFLKSLSERLRQVSRAKTSSLVADMATPVKMLITRPPVFINLEATVAQAARKMRQAEISSVLVAGEPPGIITDRDLRRRVLANDLGPETPVQQVMSSPLKTLPAESAVYEALFFMLQAHIHHLPLTEQGRIVGLITDTDLLRYQAKSPLYLLKRLNKAAGADSLAGYAGEIAATAAILFQSGLNVVQIGRIIAALNDALVARLLNLAEQSLGPPPTPYAWLVFGSEGRQEQVLLTDQDNALVYHEESRQAQLYFERLAQQVVTGLAQAGVPPCAGGYMATRWRYPLGEWERRFSQWIQTPEPQALLEAAIFFDFRPVYGQLDLTPLEKILQQAGQHGLFLAHMARLSLQFQPPLSFFRRIRQEEDGVNLKKGGIGPIVSLARLYALAAGVTNRPTLARLEAAARHGLLSPESSELLSEAFRFFLHVRLREQIQASRAGKVPGNSIRLESLSSLERRHLKDAFLAIREVQSMTALHFQTDRLG